MAGSMWGLKTRWWFTGCSVTERTANPRAEAEMTMKKALPIAFLVLWLLLFLVASADAGSTQKISGYISDSVCGTKGATVGYADCTTKCLSKGAPLAIVVDGTRQLLTIDNPDIVKGHECHHVLIT